MLDTLAELNRHHAQSVWRPGDRDAHRAVRDGLSHADLRSRPDGPVQGAESRSSSCTGRIHAQARHLCGQLSSGAASGRARTCGSSSFTIAVGTSTTICLGTSRCSAKAPTSLRRAGQDLKQRGLLDDTLVIWGGEFGRTVYCQGDLTETNYGRDHHPRCFTHVACGRRREDRNQCSARPTTSGYNVVSDPVHVHDFQATMLHCLGIDHQRLTYKFQGRHFRLTDVAGKVVSKILS